MPVALFVCPHCEKHAEVQVTSVTRSRPCPHCGEVVVLQVSAKDKGRRRALLVASGKPTGPIPDEPKSAAGPAYEPLPLEGDVFERMKMDPEIQAFRRRFIIGFSVLATIIVTMTIWHFVGGKVVSEVSAMATSPKKELEVTSKPIDPKALPANTVAMRRGAAQGSPQQLNLSFEPPPAAASETSVPELPVAAAPSPPQNFVMAPPQAKTGIEAKENNSDGGKKVQLAMTDPRVQAAAALERFLVANNIDAMLATVADRHKVEPKIRAYLEAHPLTPVSYESLTISNGAGPTGERSIVITLKDGTTREANVVREDGRSVVDWPSFVAWSDMEWAQFMDKKPAAPVLFRVIAEADRRFDNAFSDAKNLACLKLSNPKDTAAEPIFAYVERTSVMGQELDFLMREAAGKPTKLTLHLKYPTEATSKDQVWIDSVLANGWMVPRDKSTAQAQVR